MNDAGFYVEQFKQLHRDGIPGRWPRCTTNKAPHKPLLLVAVADTYIAGQAKNCIELSESLESQFQKYWSVILEGRRKSTVALPFYHLRRDGFWHLVPDFGEKSPPKSTRISVSALKTVFSGATLDQELHELLSKPRWAEHLRSVLITTYFAPELHSRFF